jgi:hypothetical protein
MWFGAESPLCATKIALTAAQDKEQLLRDNVFALRHKDRRVQFESKSVAAFAGGKFGLREQ